MKVSESTTTSPSKPATISMQIRRPTVLNHSIVVLVRLCGEPLMEVMSSFSSSWIV